MSCRTLLGAVGAAAVLTACVAPLPFGTRVRRYAIAGIPLGRFSMTQEREPLGTGGALASARDRAARWNLVLNADSFVETDLGALVRSGGGEAEGAARLLAVWMDDRTDYGGLVLDADDRVTRFLEKGACDAGWINGGIYLMGRPLIEALPTGPSSLERDHLPRLASASRLWAVRSRGFFRDMGTPERLAAAQREFVAVGERLALPTSPA